MVGVSGLWCAGTESVWFGTRCLLAAGPLCYGCAVVCMPANWLSNSSPALRHLPPHSPVRGLGDVTKFAIFKFLLNCPGLREVNGEWTIPVFLWQQAMNFISNRESSIGGRVVLSHHQECSRFLTRSIFIPLQFWLNMMLLWRCWLVSIWSNAQV